VAVQLVLVVGIAPAHATTTKVPVGGTGQVVGEVDPGREWLGDGILHVRDRVLATLQFPDTGGVGVGETTVSFNLDTTTFTGVTWGSGTVDFGGGGYDSTFQGTIHPDPTVPGGLVGEFRIVGHGWGDLEGTQLRATAVELIALGQQTYEGVSFVPGDG
jgi:hypothetical protein